MTDAEDLSAGSNYCAIAQWNRRGTDPLALGFLHDIVLELQTDLQAVAAKLRRIAEPQPDDVVPLRRAIARE